MPQTTEYPVTDSTEDSSSDATALDEKSLDDGTDDTMWETGVGGEDDTDDDNMPPPTGAGSDTKV